MQISRMADACQSLALCLISSTAREVGEPTCCTVSASNTMTVHSSRLDVVEDVRKAGRAAEGDHNRVAAPADQHLHVLPGFPENLDVLQAEHLQGTAQPDVDLCFAALRGAGDGVSSQTCLAAHMLHQAS